MPIVLETSEPVPVPVPVAVAGGVPLQAHDHLCVLYRGEQQRDELMVEFLADGLSAGHKVYCMMAPAEHPEIRSSVDDRLRPAGDPWSAGRPPELPVLEFTQPSGSHLATGGFASDQMLGFWERWAESTFLEQRHVFARVGADMTWATQFTAMDFIADLTRYESRFNLWARKYPQVTICMYDLDRFGGEVIVPIVNVHPKIWMNGVVLENPYYLDSDYLLAHEAEALARDDRSLAGP